MATNTSSTNITTRTQLASGAVPGDAGFTVETLSVVTNTTTVDKTLGGVITKVSYIPYMRGQEIEFVGYRLRPYREIFHYFDNNPVNRYIERPNIIETSSLNPALKDLKSGIVSYAGSSLTASLAPPFGVMSLDGLTPNARGNGYIANLFITAINNKFGSTIPLKDINSLPGNEFPVSQ